MKILLLSGTGAMGISLADILSEKGHQLIITTRKQREARRDNIQYIIWNAHNNQFLESLLSEKYDAIVDFMVYEKNEFRDRYKRFLNSTGQYLYLSSSRVYAEADGYITEDSPRLLDICEDYAYLSTDEYALAKARQKNLLTESKCKNYTIIRPYIIYNSNRLQLGTLEKEYWLRRVLNRKTIIFQKEIAEKKTTLTYGYDVAFAMSMLIGNNRAYGETYHITGEEYILWGDVLKIYYQMLSEHGLDGKYILEDTTDDVARLFGNYYQIHFDRLYDRKFDNSKIINICGDGFSFTPIREGLEKSLKAFLENPLFLAENLLWEAHCDGLTREVKTVRTYDIKENIKYFIFRNMPDIGKMIKKIKK